jgi:hypothetical protein
MATCASCGKIEEGELEAFCQHCGERREAVATPSPAGNAANKSEDEIVEVSAFPLFLCGKLTAGAGVRGGRAKGAATGAAVDREGIIDAQPAAGASEGELTRQCEAHFDQADPVRV